MMNYYERQYRSTQVGTASNRRLVVYLYDAAIRHVADAARAMKEDRGADCGVSVGKALDIVIELAAALDFQASPQLSTRLSGLYNFLIETLALAQTKRDLKSLRACAGILTTLRNAWEHVTRGGETHKPKPESENSVAVAV